MFSLMVAAAGGDDGTDRGWGRRVFGRCQLLLLFDALAGNA
jgi:hypothetical protein